MAYSAINEGFLIASRVLLRDSSDSYDVSKAVLDVMVKKDFNSSYPLFIIDFKVTEKMRNIMRDNDINIYLRISSYNTDDSTDSDLASIDSSSVSEINIVYEGSIRIYEKPYATTVSKTEDDSDENGTVSESAPFVYYRVSGIPEELISNNETILNNVYKSAEPADVLVNLISSSSSNLNTIIQETENKNVYDQILIPPLSLIPAIKFLDENYFLYKYGMNIFLDSNDLYVYSPTSKNTPSTNLIEVSVIDPNSTDSTASLQKNFRDSNGNIKLVYTNVPNYYESKKIITHTLGSTTIFGSYDSNFNLVNRSDNNDDSFKKTRYLWNDKCNKLQEDRETNAITNNRGLEIIVSNIDPSYINPLTIIRVSSTLYPDIEGDYFIDNLSYMLNSSDLIHYADSIKISAIKK